MKKVIVLFMIFAFDTVISIQNAYRENRRKRRNSKLAAMGVAPYGVLNDVDIEFVKGFEVGCALGKINDGAPLADGLYVCVKFADNIVKIKHIAESYGRSVEIIEQDKGTYLLKLSRMSAQQLAAWVQTVAQPQTTVKG